jgi:hypothetical protein
MVHPDVSPPVHPQPISNWEDVLTQSQMLKTPDKEDFIKSQKAEIDGLLKFDVIDIHHISSLPAQVKLLSSIWSYCHERLPNGTLLKYKSRICVHRKEQAFCRDYWETYTPVASWATMYVAHLIQHSEFEKGR